MKPFALLLAPALCWAATTPATIDDLIGMTRPVSGEFAAEALIRIAGIDKVEKPRKIALLEEAFGRAGDAQLSYRRSAAITRFPGPAGYFNRMYKQGLDAMSLRLKAVNAMIPLDPAKAREMFRRIPPIKLPRVACGEYLIYDVDGFYDTLSRIASETFTAAEIEKGEPARLMQPYIAAVGSAVQIPAVARLIAAGNVSDKDFPGLMRVFAKAMTGISGDDRSFTHADAGPAIRVLVQAAQLRKAAAAPLLEAYRGYLVANMSAARCADDESMFNDVQSFGFASPNAGQEQGQYPSAYFNSYLRVPPVEEIQEQEVTASKLEGAANGLRGCDDDACKVIVGKYEALIFDSGRRPYPTAHKETPEWGTQFQELLAALAAWQPAGEPFAARHFREKSALYSEVAGIAPNAAGREAVLRAELEYLGKAKAAAENRVQWFLAVNALIGRVALDPLGLGKLAGDLRNGGDPVIALFAELDAAAPRTPDQILPLF